MAVTTSNKLGWQLAILNSYPAISGHTVGHYEKNVVCEAKTVLFTEVKLMLASPHVLARISYMN